ncbi:hypothetical protein [Paenibacillus agilis]|uniref:Uncharacterized protein n=1 Tax=Paenibacillus agilis TaxID=3020863 RepID=A0A559IWL0_9BACL|nr:hypothetical protein [Paenibacillus agilis]TVX92020.1 hypothetical protein FPZ44_02480 [Paenibacillus agilis]
MNICINQIRVNVLSNLASINIGTTFMGSNQNTTSQYGTPEGETAPAMNSGHTHAAEPVAVPEAELMEEPIILPQLAMPPFEMPPIEPRPPE